MGGRGLGQPGMQQEKGRRGNPGSCQHQSWRCRATGGTSTGRLAATRRHSLEAVDISSGEKRSPERRRRANQPDLVVVVVSSRRRDAAKRPRGRRRGRDSDERPAASRPPPPPDSGRELPSPVLLLHLRPVAAVEISSEVRILPCSIRSGASLSGSSAARRRWLRARNRGPRRTCRNSERSIRRRRSPGAADCA